MTMVALDAARTKIVPTGSLEARWMVSEEDAAEYIADAKKHPKMQALMALQAERRLEDEARSKAVAEAEREYRASRRAG